LDWYSSISSRIMLWIDLHSPALVLLPTPCCLCIQRTTAATFVLEQLTDSFCTVVHNYYIRQRHLWRVGYVLRQHYVHYDVVYCMSLWPDSRNFWCNTFVCVVWTVYSLLLQHAESDTSCDNQWIITIIIIQLTNAVQQLCNITIYLCATKSTNLLCSLFWSSGVMFHWLMVWLYFILCRPLCFHINLWNTDFSVLQLWFFVFLTVAFSS